MQEIDCFPRKNSEITKMKKTLKDIKTTSRSFIFVKCSENLDIVLKHANEFGLTTSDFRWVFPGVIILSEISRNLPQNVIAIDLPGSHDRFKPMGEENTLLLDDALSVLEKTLKENSDELFEGNRWNFSAIASSLKR